MRFINIVDPINPSFVPGQVNIWKFIADENPELVDSMGNHSQNLSCRIFARKCAFNEIDKTTALNFLQRNHLKKAYGHQRCFGLTFENKLMAVMTFSKSRYNKDYTWEIIRYACEAGYTIVGGASKLLNGAINELGSNSIFSYSENMIGVGNLYEKMGFEFLGETGKGFFWFKNGEIINREQATKFKLSQKYPEYREQIYSTTISQFMKSLGYLQVFDMGNKRWGMNPCKQKPAERPKHNFIFTRIDDEIVAINENESNNFVKLNIHTVECREMIKDGEVRKIPVQLVSDFIDDGWSFNNKVPGTSGMIKIKKDGQTKYIKKAELETYTSQGWMLTNRNSKDKKYTRAPATNGRVSVKKDGIKKMVSLEEAERMVRDDGWELGAASCWRLASDVVKSLGRKLGYNIP